MIAKAIFLGRVSLRVREALRRRGIEWDDFSHFGGGVVFVINAIMADAAMR